MPELPEVETMVRGVGPGMIGRTVAAFEACPCACRPISMTPRLATISKRLQGTKILELSRIGKRIVFLHDSGDRLVIEPRMTGLLLIDDPPDVEHLRLEWTLGGRKSPGKIRFWDRRGLGTCTLYNATQWEQWLREDRLGPDALAMSPADWIARFAPSTTEIKVALLDQKRIAGIGNLYASEILHRSAIHPQSRCCDLSSGDYERIARATAEILETAIRYEGSTLGDGTYRNALNQSGSYQNHHSVYAKQNEPCHTCGNTPIIRIVQAQRATFYCPGCQKKKRRRR
ncbi:MAG TPA: DNA-formamidopyrimidine glycosylase family protein [Planctomycetaceae bacterium]|nr:DNA-formamidopyrimidine glycosylase family protein [Planctomycetaceae bacterium]